jgi:hypothetical protein
MSSLIVPSICRWCRGLAAVLAAVAASSLCAAEIGLRFDPACPPARFAASEIRQALAARGLDAVLSSEPGTSVASTVIRLALAAPDDPVVADLQPEGFALRVRGDDARQTYTVVSRDPAGVLYGGLELAEQIRIAGLDGVRATVQNPHLTLRGVKFNIPLDARTPSYTDVCDSAQQNIPVVWEFDFWKAYLDNLARHRFNAVTLWSLHPFPSLVRVPKYPDVALDDVLRSTVAWQENYDLQGRGFDAPEILGNLETVKRMTIDEKIEHWRQVMRYAKDRNIDFYVVTWNIFVNGTAGKYGITDTIDNPITADYFRHSVRQMFLTYPELKGIGLTTGENMPGASAVQKEDWAFRTYGQGVLDAAAAHPERQFTLIHRQHMTGAAAVLDRFAPLRAQENIEFVFSFKYAQAHVLSSMRQPFSDGFVREIRAAGAKTVWTLRNDDNYHFRWGAPDFVRAFIQNIPHDVSRGFYYGSDQWIWGREILSRTPQTPRQLEIEKHWYHWMLWGRLGYDPKLGNERIIAILQARYPQVPADKLFEAWQNASLIYPLVTGFHWGALDFQWYIEACKSRPGPAQTESGFHDVNRFITLPPHPGTDDVSIPKYVEMFVPGRALQGTTPIELSDRITAHASRAMQVLQQLPPARDIDDRELGGLLCDIETMSCLGRYYADKIHGATCLARFRQTKEIEDYSQAEDDLRRAAQWWARYVALARSQYRNPLWTNRVGYVDWDALTKEVQGDIELARRTDSIP